MNLRILGLIVILLSESLHAGDRKDSGAWLCEILFRKGDVLFLGQVELPRSDPRDHTIAAVGFDGRWNPHPPPDPGYATNLQQVETIAQEGKIVAPVASRTHNFGASAYLKEKTFEIGVTDLATGGRLPARADEVVYTCWPGVNPYYPLESAIFRIQRVAKASKPLRDDPQHWKERTALIRKEILDRGDWLRQDPQRLPIAAVVLREKVLLDQLRGQILSVLEQPESPKRSDLRDAIAAVDALIITGNQEDLPLLLRASEHSKIGGHLLYFLNEIAMQFGLSASAPVIDSLLMRRDPASDPEPLKRLRALNKTIAKRMRVDEALIPLVRSIDLDPADFRMEMCESKLLEIVPQTALSKRETERLKRFVRNRSGSWYFHSDIQRQWGIRILMDLMQEPGHPSLDPTLMPKIRIARNHIDQSKVIKEKIAGQPYDPRKTRVELRPDGSSGVILNYGSTAYDTLWVISVDIDSKGKVTKTDAKLYGFE